MTLEKAFEWALLKGFIKLRTLVLNKISVNDLFRYAGHNGYYAEMAIRIHGKGKEYDVVELTIKDKDELDLTRRELLPCSIPKDTIKGICRHWKQCHIGERGDCEKSGYKDNSLSEMSEQGISNSSVEDMFTM